MNKRFQEVLNYESLKELKYDRMTDFERVNGLTLRLMFSKFAIVDFFQDYRNIPFGVGLGDRKAFLNTAYENHNMARTIKDEKLGYYNYNTHNQYVEFLLGIGVIGLFYFLWMMRHNFKHSKKDWVLNWFYILMLWTFLFEAVLNRNKGIVLFVFWSIVFMSFQNNFKTQKKIVKIK